MERRIWSEGGGRKVKGEGDDEKVEGRERR